MPLYRFLHRGVNFTSDTIKIAYLTSDYVPDYNASDVNYDDISAYEVSGTGYTTGGFTLGTKTVTQGTDSSSGAVVDIWDAADTNTGNLTLTDAAWWCIYKDSGTPGTSPLIKSNQFQFGPHSPDTDPLNVQFAADGILRIRYDW